MFPAPVYTDQFSSDEYVVVVVFALLIGYLYYYYFRRNMFYTACQDIKIRLFDSRNPAAPLKLTHVIRVQRGKCTSILFVYYTDS
jgi:hypothetical protein